MKKLLFISYALPPYLSPQSIQIGRFLQGLKGKYDLYVLCAQPAAEADATLYPDIFDGIPAQNILKVPDVRSAKLDYIRNRALSLFYQRPDVFKGWARRAYGDCVQKFDTVQFDAVATFSFPLSLNLLGHWLQQHYKCKWIAHQSDPWADNPFMRFGPWMRRVNERLEAKTYDAAHQLIFTSQEAADFYRQKYPQWQQKISFINHSFDEDLFPNQLMPPENSVKTIRYIGGFYGHRTAAPLLEAIKRLPVAVAGKVRFEIIGANMKTRLLVQRAGLPDALLRVRGQVPYGESLALMAASDALLSIDAPLSDANIFFPSKLADYIGSGRPIIGISSPTGPAARILASLGYHCHSHDQVDHLIKTFEQVAAGQYPPAEQGAVQDYDKHHNVKKLEEFINSV